MFHYLNSITNSKGDALTGFFVRAIDPISSDVVSIYADTSSTPIISVSGLDNAAEVDDDGNVSFYIVGGSYHLDIYAADGATFLRRILNVPMYDVSNPVYPNNSYIYFTDSDGVTPVQTLGINASNELFLGDSNATFINIVPPIGRPVSSVVTTSTYTVLPGDNNLTFNATCVVTLPSPSAFPGRELRVRVTSAMAVTSASANVIPVAGGSAGTAILAATTGKWAILVSDSVVWQTMASN